MPSPSCSNGISTNKALIITGINDETHHLEQATRHWAGQYNLEPVFHTFGWEGSVDEADQRLSGLRQHFKEVGAQAIIGVSAGASAAVIIASENPELAYINVCGRVHQAGNSIYNFAKYRSRAPIFVEMVDRAEPLLANINPEKSLVFHSLFDELVPRKAAFIEGVRCIAIPTPTHALGIYATLRFYGKRMTNLVELFN